VVKDIQIGYPEMTFNDAFNAGMDGYKRGWKNIPPYSIAAVRQHMTLHWQDGWRYAKMVEEGQLAEIV
jgi:ribosome modulation factor